MTGVILSGKAGAGKSTFARCLLAEAELLDIPCEKMAFADELKRQVFEQYGITKDMVGGRDALIRYGEAKRLADPDYWIRFVSKRHRMANVCGVLVVIDDMRFLREYEWALDEEFTTVRMVASRLWRHAQLTRQGMDGSFASSIEGGETELDGFKHDHSFRNGLNIRLDASARWLLSALA